MLAFWKSDRGTDLVEYTLILAFIALAGAATFIGMGSTTTTLWSAVNNRLASANQGS
jgi:Flp pilus assembly pilin Flp